MFDNNSQLQEFLHSQYFKYFDLIPMNLIVLCNLLHVFHIICPTVCALITKEVYDRQQSSLPARCCKSNLHMVKKYASGKPVHTENCLYAYQNLQLTVFGLRYILSLNSSLIVISRSNWNRLSVNWCLVMEGVSAPTGPNSSRMVVHNILMCLQIPMIRPIQCI